MYDRELDPSEFHYLSNTLREDGEEHSGIVFLPLGDGRVVTWADHGSSHYEREVSAYSMKTLPVEEARAYWRELLAKTYAGFTRYSHQQRDGIVHPHAQI